MSNTVFKLRRSSVAGKVPNTSTLAIGELGLNLTDRKLYSSDGTNVWETGANLTTLTVSTNTSVNNVIISGGVYANGSYGSSGQALTTNGSAVYWSTIVGTNTNASYNWSNTHTFSNTVTLNGNVVFGTSAGISANGSYGTNGQVLTTNGTSAYWSTSTSSAGLSNVSIIESRQQYTGDGSTTSFTVTGGYVPYKLSVYVNGVLLRGNTDVTISSGSTFTISPAPESGALIDAIGLAPGVFTSNIPVSQTFTGDGSTTTFTVIGGYVVGAINVYGNGVRYASSEVTTSSGSTIVFATAPPNGVIIDVIGVTPVVALNSSVRQSFTGTGACTTFTVAGGYVPGNIDVYMNGIKLANSEIVTTSGTTVVFNTAPPNNSVIDVVGLNIGLTSAYNAPVRQTFTGDGSTTSFTVTGGYTPGNLDVYGNGVKYASSEVTTSSGSAIVFGTAPPNGVVIDVVGYYISNIAVGNAGSIRQTFTGDGSTTSFTVSGGYNPNNIDVYGNGIRYPSSDVTTSSGSAIVFAVAPPNGVVIDVVGYYLNNLTTVNTAQAYTWTGPHTFNANIVANTIYSTSNINATSFSVGSSTIANSTGVYTGVVNAASHTVGSSTIANSTGVYTGVVNGSTISVGTSFTANATVVNAVSYNVGSAVLANSTGTFDSLGNLRSIPVQGKTSSYTLTSTDNGTTISSNSGVTVNGAVITANQVFTIFNNSTASITITQGTGATMYLAGSTTTGNRTLANYGVATLLCVAANTFVISGAGLT